MKSSLLNTALIVILISPSFLFATDKDSVGLIEKVRFYPGDMIMHAKLDTGAQISSLNATDLERFERNGTLWVRFQVRNRDGKTVQLEREVLRIALIFRSSACQSIPRQSTMSFY